MPPTNRRLAAARQRGIERRALANQPSILRSVSLAAAQRDQGEVTVTDLALANVAQLRRPGVRWWWGARKLPGNHGAYCYLCDELIVGYAPNHPITRAAQAAILAHRDERHTGQSTTTGSQPPPDQDGADQSEGSPNQ